MISAEQAVRVLCVDDHAFLIEGLRSRMNAEAGLQFVGGMTSMEGVVDEVMRTGAEIVLMDIECPGPDVFEVMIDLQRRCPRVKVIVLSAYVRDHYIDSAVAAGAWGYLSKADDPATIIEAVGRVARGEFAFGPEIVHRIQNAHTSGHAAQPGGNEVRAKPTSKIHLLTPREQQILRMIGRGQSRVEIAKIIHRSPKTVDAHRASIMEKLGIHDRVELARYAIREGLVEV
jgi:DNA-binding NarL/FixJ family response regulator